MTTMIAGRVQEYGEPMKLDRDTRSQARRSTDVLVEVKACGIVPNLARVVSNFFGTVPDPKALPPLPAIFGLDPTGVIARVGDQVRTVRPGDPRLRQPGAQMRPVPHAPAAERRPTARASRSRGYFGRSQEIMKAYPYGGLCQSTTAPEDAIVKLPDKRG